MLNNSQQVLQQTLNRVFQGEITIIRAYHRLLSGLPMVGSVSYIAGNQLLTHRLFTPGYKIAIDTAHKAGGRLGSLLIPRFRNNEVSWEKFFTAILQYDLNNFPEGDPEEFHSSLYKDGEEVDLVNGTKGLYRPHHLLNFRERIIDAQFDYIIELISVARLFPEFISLYLGLKPEIVQDIQELSASSLKHIKNAVLFPRVINFKSDSFGESSASPRKASAWAFEVLADVKLGHVKNELIELLRYDTQFTNVRQDIVSHLNSNLFARDYDEVHD
ncbi:hypothetical protein [Photorhabdus heterorhabditis]|uniref:hypothetical protein n=1 Tax=Photorhabdus heterorhabditis TaxID=880156 RepID=UPI001561E623|nr:hypothetical protein [Photorhabdus heterorhabditis]NRN29018.1 hypothetical protein [Photorhabdus heterorhabditis subsp. aluminescens]